MKLRHKKKLAIITTVAAVSLFLVGAAIYALTFQSQIDNGGDSPPTSDQPAPNDSPNQTDTPVTDTPPASKQPGSGSDTPPAPVPGPGGKSTVEVAITSTTQQPTTLQIRTVIYSVQGSGICTLSLTRSGYETVTQTAEIQPLPTTSTCKGFDIPLSQLATGNWQATVTFNNNAVTGTTTKSITIN